MGSPKPRGFQSKLPPPCPEATEWQDLSERKGKSWMANTHLWEFYGNDGELCGNCTKTIALVWEVCGEYVEIEWNQRG